ncbi:MAG: glutamate synthase-related protein, partial [Pseudomonadales bacterium]|nr:glutamate synthase-related protein [Pseudomonadales bacterium]
MPESLRIVLEFLVYGFVLLLAALSLLILVFYIQDRLQTKHAVRHNFPVIGRLRYLFESFGEFFRQYFIALDREEMPFNRAQRSWVYRAAKNLDNTAAFGSTVDLRIPGTIYFTNSLYPLLDAETSVAPVTIGPLAAQPYTTTSFFHISAMSYGAISVPAIKALANGARQANIWLNTGEGGL